MSFTTREKVWNKRNKEPEPEIVCVGVRESEVYSTKRTEYGCTRKKGKPILAHADQFRARFKPEDVEIPEEEHKETEEEENETEQKMEESENDVTDLEDEDRLRSPLKGQKNKRRSSIDLPE